jgi:hypothetical protein
VKKAAASETKDTLMGVLTYIDSPFKLLVVLLLAVVGFIGHFAYVNQGVFLSVYMKQRELPKLNESRFDDVSALLMKELKAEVVAIFAVDAMLNKRVSVRAYQREGGREAKVEGIDVGLFTSNSANNIDVIDLIASKVPCSEYKRPQSEIGLWYMYKGITYTCRISVPPEINQFIGQITLGWKSKPDDLDFVHDILTVAARALIK